MKRIVLALLAVLVMAGCSTKGQYIPNAEIDQALTAENFVLGTVQDESGFVFKDPDEAFSLEEEMGNALQAALEKEGLFDLSSKYALNTRILDYSPGNAFTRWLVPGAGATRLKTETTIVSEDGTVFATLPVEREIAAGGGYTIGAWKYVFQDVSQEIVKLLKKNVAK